MTQGRNRGVMTLTVIGSQVLARADGRVAIRLETRQRGSIAFEINQKAIDTLRRQLATAEKILRQPTTKN
jgi:hypothetical protein